MATSHDLEGADVGLCCSCCCADSIFCFEKGPFALLAFERQVASFASCSLQLSLLLLPGVCEQVGLVPVLRSTCNYTFEVRYVL